MRHRLYIEKHFNERTQSKHLTNLMSMLIAYNQDFNDFLKF